MPEIYKTLHASLSQIMQFLTDNYREVSTSRGYKYRYYFSEPSPGRPTLLLVHGFPGLAAEWHHQILYFKSKGYGLVVPDMLGYGGTDKPQDYAAYVHTLLAKDLVDILDHEKLLNVVAVGHDWGSKTTSVLANLYADRFLGFAFLALGYTPPDVTFTYEQLNALATQAFGYEIIGYWDFFNAPDSHEVVMKHIESFWDILHTKDVGIWKDSFCPKGSLRTFLETDSRTPRGSFVSEELRELYNHEFSKGGFQGPTNYYRAAINSSIEDSKLIPLESYDVVKPVFVGGASKDLGEVSAQEAKLTRFCSNGTFKVFDTGHWVHLESPEEVNQALEEWIGTFIS